MHRKLKSRYSLNVNMYKYSKHIPCNLRGRQGGPTHKQYTTDLYIVTNIKSDYMKASVRILKFVLQEIFSIKS